MAAVARMRLKAAEVVLAGGGRSKSDRGWRDGGPRARGGHRRATRGPGASSALAELRAHVIPGTLRASRVPRRTSGPPRAPLGSSGALGFTWRPWPPPGLRGLRRPPFSCPGLPGPPRACASLSGQLGPGPRAAVGPAVPSALPLTPVPYQCLTSALPSALPREPYEFTRRALPIHKRVLLLRQGRRVDLEDRMRPACKVVGFAR